MMLIVPLLDLPAQTVSISLGGQQCSINLRTLGGSLYCDLYVGTTLIIAGVLCLNSNRIVRNTYLGFIGDLSFYDTQGTSDPVSPGLDTRYELWYI